MTSRTLVACSLAITVGGAACDESPPSIVVVAADSAGVAVETNVAGSLEASSVWALASDPTVDIGGGAEPEVPLYLVTAVSPLESGHVAVGTTVPPRVLLFERADATPDGFEPYALSGVTLWGVHTDELDVESVRAYEVAR